MLNERHSLNMFITSLFTFIYFFQTCIKPGTIIYAVLTVFPIFFIGPQSCCLACCVSSLLRSKQLREVVSTTPRIMQHVL